MSAFYCPVCRRTESDPSARFCDVCGARLAPLPRAPRAASADGRGWGGDARDAVPATSESPRRSAPEDERGRPRRSLDDAEREAARRFAEAERDRRRRSSDDEDREASRRFEGDAARAREGASPDGRPRRAKRRRSRWLVVWLLVGLAALALLLWWGFLEPDAPSGGLGSTLDLRGAARPTDLDRLLARCYGAPPRVPSGGGGEAPIVGTAKTALRGAANAIGPEPTPQQERRVGEAVVRSLVEHFGVSGDGAQIGRLDAISGRLARVVPGAASDAFRFTPLASDNANAFMAPGGRGVVFDGLLRAMPEDDAAAFVLGHEIAHAALGHGRESLRLAMATEKAAQWINGQPDAKIDEALGGVVASAVRAPYDQDLEFEADRLGLCLAAEAGFDPAGAKSALETLARLHGEPLRFGPRGGLRVAYDLLESHPPTAERLRYVEQLLAARRRAGGR